DLIQAAQTGGHEKQSEGADRCAPPPPLESTSSDHGLPRKIITASKAPGLVTDHLSQEREKLTGTSAGLEHTAGSRGDQATVRSRCPAGTPFMRLSAASRPDHRPWVEARPGAPPSLLVVFTSIPSRVSSASLALSATVPGGC